MKSKKGDFELSMLAKIILVVIALLIIITVSYLAKDKILALLSKVGNILRFGS